MLILRAEVKFRNYMGQDIGRQKLLNLALHCTLPPFCSPLRQRCFIYKIKKVLAVTGE